MKPFLLATSLATSLAALAGCATQAPVGASGAAASGPPQTFALEVLSWGQPVHRWTVAADGAATLAKRVEGSGGPFPPYTREHRRFTLGADALGRLRDLAVTIPRPVPTDDKCQQRITDAAYGTLTLGRAGAREELAFYDGCFDAYYRPYVDTLKAMDEIVIEAGKAAPVERLEEVRADSG